MLISQLGSYKSRGDEEAAREETRNTASVVWCPPSPRHLSRRNHIFAAAQQEKNFRIGVAVFACTRGDVHTHAHMRLALFFRDQT